MLWPKAFLRGLIPKSVKNRLWRRMRECIYSYSFQNSSSWRLFFLSIDKKRNRQWSSRVFFVFASACWICFFGLHPITNLLVFGVDNQLLFRNGKGMRTRSEPIFCHTFTHQKNKKICHELYIYYGTMVYSWWWWWCIIPGEQRCGFEFPKCPNLLIFEKILGCHRSRAEMPRSFDPAVPSLSLPLVDDIVVILSLVHFTTIAVKYR